jgi:tRNA-2-methylthio-N6-dimethylallyladenosine synthase
MKGCDERCSFCIVPHTRGPERYRPSEDVIAEIETLVDAGVREVTLLGQTVNSYRDPTNRLARAPMADPTDPDESEFAALLRGIAEGVPRLARLRYTSPHPRHVTPSLVAAHRDLDVLARHVHLPVQSGSDRVLKRMIRRYTRDEYLERAEELRCARPGLTLSTDIIVGFPGETDGDFERTLELVEAVRFSGLFGFQYSRRPYTPAQKLEDDVPPSTKRARLGTLFELSERLQREHLDTLVGSLQHVLVEGASKAGSGRVTGRTERNEIVHLADEGGASLVGEIALVRITRSFKHSLDGQLTDESRTRRAAAATGPSRRVLPVVA